MYAYIIHYIIYSIEGYACWRFILTCDVCFEIFTAEFPHPSSDIVQENFHELKSFKNTFNFVMQQKTTLNKSNYLWLINFLKINNEGIHVMWFSNYFNSAAILNTITSNSIKYFNTSRNVAKHFLFVSYQTKMTLFWQNIVHFSYILFYYNKCVWMPHNIFIGTFPFLVLYSSPRPPS